MEHKIITIFCLIDEYLKITGIKDDIRAKVSNSEILLIGYIAVNDFNGNYYKAYQYCRELKIVNMLEYSRFIRRLSKLENVIEKLFLFLGKLFAKLENTKIYSVDSFPVEICKITREKRCNLWSDESLKGFNASKKRYFYGFKVHMVVTTDRKPVCVYISEGSIHDVTAAYRFLPYMPENSIIIGDKGYVSKKLKNFLNKFGIKISPVFRNNMQKDKEYLIKRKIRKKIETAFSIITSKFGKVIKAVSINGFLIKLKLFILSYSINCFLKLNDNHKNLLFK
jgi:hypothetical protein